MSFPISLTVIERRVLGHLMPTQGAYEDLATGRTVKATVGLSREDEDRLNLRQEPVEGQPGMMHVLFEKDVAEEIAGRVIELTGREIALIVQLLTALNEKKELEDSQFTLYEKFVVHPPEEKATPGDGLKKLPPPGDDEPGEASVG